MPGFGYHEAQPGVIIFVIFAAIVISLIIYTIIKGISTKVKNDNSPILTEDAVIVGRRTDVSGMDHTSTYYFATFQLGNGDRLELALKGTEYGMLAEGDRGKLTYQGTRYLSFVRE